MNGGRSVLVRYKYFAGNELDINDINLKAIREESRVGDLSLICSASILGSAQEFAKPIELWRWR